MDVGGQRRIVGLDERTALPKAVSEEIRRDVVQHLVDVDRAALDGRPSANASMR